MHNAVLNSLSHVTQRAVSIGCFSPRRRLIGSTGRIVAVYGFTYTSRRLNLCLVRAAWVTVLASLLHGLQLFLLVCFRLSGVSPTKHTTPVERMIVCLGGGFCGFSFSWPTARIWFPNTGSRAMTLPSTHIICTYSSLFIPVNCTRQASYHLMHLFVCQNVRLYAASSFSSTD